MRKLAGLQYLRGFAASAVVLFHAADRSGWNLHAGEAGVDLFFLLSGFLMVAITGPGTQPLPFIADRICRIVPVYWIATTVMLAGALAGAFPNLKLEASHVVASYLFVPGRSPDSGFYWPLLVPGWTLNYEMMFYGLFAALLPLRRQARQIALLTLLLAALVALRLFIHPQGAIVTTYSDPILLEFAGGCWLGILWRGPGDWPRWLGIWTALAALTGLSLMAAYVPQVHRAVGFGIPAALLLASVLALERRGAVGTHRLPLFIGDASYSIYIWHTLAISATLAASHKLGLPRAPTVAAGFAGGIGVGTIAYLLIERPILTFFRERRHVRGFAVPAGP